MYSIKDNLTQKYIINKSKFIVELIRIDNDNIVDILNEIKLKYKNADHYCYAYIFNDFYKISDDKEPTGTGGIPILKVLQSKKLNHILCVVIRYFGGIKLGIGGLFRAYQNCVVNTILTANIKPLMKLYKIEICFSYDKLSNINNLLYKSKIISKEFKDTIIFKFLCSQNTYNDIKKELFIYSSNTIIIDEFYTLED
ncbi:MAG: YigZ family protein [Bacilli bacterium]